MKYAINVTIDIEKDDDIRVALLEDAITHIDKELYRFPGIEIEDKRATYLEYINKISENKEAIAYLKKDYKIYNGFSIVSIIAAYKKFIEAN